MKGCGSCTFCCSMMAVTELEKPRNTVCQHQGRGCKIYEERPQSCADFECFWLTSQKWQGNPLPKHLRPDRSHVMLSSGQDCLVAHVDPGFPNAWRKDDIAFLLGRWRATSPTPIYVAIGKRRFQWPDGAEFRAND